MRYTKILAGVATLALLASACSLDREPHGAMSTGQIQAEPESKLNELLNGAYAQLKAWADPMHRCGEYAGDNIMIRGSSTDPFYEFISFARTPQNRRLQSFWDAGYKAIAQCSNVINMIPEEGASASVRQRIGECYYIRGMLYFYLVRAYGRPYFQSPETNLGVPIVNGTPDDVSPSMQFPGRATVAETYEHIIKDLKRAEELLVEPRGVAYASRGAAQAMLSRVYLYMSGTYESPNADNARLAVEYASKVIASGQYSLLPRETFMQYPRLLPESNKESIFVIKRRASEYSGYDHYYGVGGMYANIGGMGWGEMFASADYLALLDETGRNDFRPAPHRRIVDARAAFIEPVYLKGETGDYEPVFRFIKQDSPTELNYLQLGISSQTASEVVVTEGEVRYTLTPIKPEEGIYSIAYRDGRSYTGVIDYRIKLNRAYPEFYITKCSREGENSHLHSPVISRLGEVYLNRAEAYAKMGDYSAALADLNLIRERSIVGGGYASLTGETAPELIEKERRLELAYQAERSYDVFRNGRALTRRYPGPHKQMEDIPATDYRVVYYIPQDAISAYPGTLQQNPIGN